MKTQIWISVFLSPLAVSAWTGQFKARVGLSKEPSVTLFALHCRHTTKEKLGGHQCRVSSTQILEHHCYVWICLCKLTPGYFLNWSWSSTRSVLSPSRVRHTGMSPCLFWASHAHLTDFLIPKLSQWLKNCWRYMSGIKNPKVVLQKWKKNTTSILFISDVWWCPVWIFIVLSHTGLITASKVSWTAQVTSGSLW